jgi:putative membrane protein
MSSTKNVTDLSKYIMTLPETEISLLSMVFISFIAGALGFLIDLVPGQSPLHDILYGGTNGVLVLGFASIMAGAITQPWVNSLGGRKMKMKQSMFLAFFSMMIFSVIYLGGCLASSILNTDLILDSIIIASAVIFAFRLLVIWGTSNISFTNSVLISSVQPLLIVSMNVVVAVLSLTSNVGYFSVIGFFLKMLVASVILILAIYSFVMVVESPMRKNLGVGSLEFLSLFLSHITEDSPELENIFSEIGEPVDTLVGVVAFRRGSDVKAILISPSVHPGPIGTIGGGNMPTIISRRFSEFTMVAHGPSTHDFNPVSVKELEKVEAAVREALDDMEYHDTASEFRRYTRKNATIGVQFFGEDMLMLATLAPEGFDDIEFGVGLSMMNLARSKCGSENVVVVDCHNSFKGETGRILAGNPEMFDLLDAVESVECPSSYHRLRVGCARRTGNFSEEDGVGESGVMAMVVEAGDQKTAYVLLDSNNMVMGFRDEIREELMKLDLDDAEVMTTDTHFVNTLSGGHNPVGKQKRDEIKNEIIMTVSDALDDLEEVSAGCRVVRIRGLHTLGPTNSTELVSTISSIVAVSRLIAPLIFVLAIIFVFAWVLWT